MAYKPLNIYYLALDRERSISPFSKHFFPTPYPLVEFHVLASGLLSRFETLTKSPQLCMGCRKGLIQVCFSVFSV